MDSEITRCNSVENLNHRVTKICVCIKRKLFTVPLNAVLLIELILFIDRSSESSCLSPKKAPSLRDSIWFLARVSSAIIGNTPKHCLSNSAMPLSCKYICLLLAL